MNEFERDLDYLGRMQDYYADERCLPSYARLMSLLGFASKSAVSKLLSRLQLQGFLSRSSDGDWVPTDRFFERTLSTQPVPAGMPVAARDVGADAFVLDQYLINRPSHTQLIPVKGDSMIDAGIHSGDLAVIERRNVANVGDIVVAIVDNEFTLKTLAKEGGKYILQPANPAYPTIRPQGNLEIFGVMVGLVRKYR
ncbi:LexA family transcriptional regulator [Chitinimonas viridis]|uniref:LexA family transcriptional regulator n=2 Tax=Chitinimonas TaxID=240411 RepID=A0ABT8AZM0_9NEIS|nr:MULTISPECIES: LexA family transcriptional regulator [Chitinimonas]MDN3575423.1 LexA family transcriptional regulator [Chitinimonas viridis]GLR14845.1 LexA repressor [Chitinimonas prasina]